jgi:hypothetical protein
MALEQLTVCDSPVSDLTPLRGMPVRLLALSGCENIRDLTPLLDCRRLERLNLPPKCHNIEFLRHHSSLKNLSYRLYGTSDYTEQTVAEFWKEYDAQKAAAQKSEARSQ